MVTQRIATRCRDGGRQTLIVGEFPWRRLGFRLDEWGDEGYRTNDPNAENNDKQHIKSPQTPHGESPPDMVRKL